MEEEKTKICLRCGEEKDLSEFPPDRTKKDGHRSSCRACRNERLSLLRRGIREERLSKYPISSLTKVKIGDYAELLVLTQYIREGFNVAFPHGSQPGWDLLVEDGNKWVRVQVKSVTQRSRSGFQISFGSHRARAVKYDFDRLIGVYPATAAIWKIPDAYNKKCSICMRDEWRWL